MAVNCIEVIKGFITGKVILVSFRFEKGQKIHFKNYAVFLVIRNPNKYSILIFYFIFIKFVNHLRSAVRMLSGFIACTLSLQELKPQRHYMERSNEASAH